jgi:asparagine synthetase B (glutamine-hydrolysing)
MCGIIGATGNDKEQIKQIIEALFVTSQIRGKHATGVSFIENGKIKTIIEPIPSKEFVKKKLVPETETIIGHVRYSTSDLAYNQPIFNDKLSIVHNGVVTQEDPKNWTEHFGYSDFYTKNDTEIILKALTIGDNPFIKFPDASMALGVLSSNGDLFCGRNYTRPLWLFKIGKISGFASTEDIILRALKSLNKKPDEIFEAEPFLFYCLTDETKSEKYEHSSSYITEDQQLHTECEKYYTPRKFK